MERVVTLDGGSGPGNTPLPRSSLAHSRTQAYQCSLAEDFQNVSPGDKTTDRVPVHVS